MFSNQLGASVVHIGEGEERLMVLTTKLAECLSEHFPELTVFCIQDIDGEDHVLATDQEGKSVFDLLVSTLRKFCFLWYYIHPTPGMKMVEAMKLLALNSNLDFVVKYPNVPVKVGFPCIVRYGKKPAGNPEKFIVKFGNPMLEDKVYTAEALNTYRSYNWMATPDALKMILRKAKEMVVERLGVKNADKLPNVRGYLLYAGCAYSYLYPQLGFGMRDIDVEVLYSPAWFTNTRAAFTRHCDIPEFGVPEYFGGKTRWLDLMWNSFHSETGNFNNDVLVYMNEMRARSDRWCTMTQRPFINLETEEVVYTPIWLEKFKKFLTEG